MFSGNLRKAVLGCFLMVLASFSAAAQQVDCEAVYNKFVAARKSADDLPKYRAALASANEYLDKCGSDPEQKTQKDYVTKQIPTLTESIKALELVARFDAAGLADNKDELLATGKELLAKNRPDSIDIAIVLASVGFSKAAADSPVDTFNDDTIRYANMVLDKINSGAVSKSYGVFKYHYKTNACADGAANTSGWMNYSIGYILAARQKKTKEALPYYYKALQTGCETKAIPSIYLSIANWFIDEGKKVEAELSKKFAAANNEETDEVKALDALRNGYFDRALDAYARAYRTADAKPDVPKASKDNYYNRLKEVYQARFDGKIEGVDQFLAKVSTTPFPDPMSEVKPAVADPPKDAEPAPAKPNAKPTAKNVAKSPAKPKAAPKKSRKK